MKAVYKKSILDRLHELIYTAKSNNKEIEYISLTPAESREVAKALGISPDDITNMYKIFGYQIKVERSFDFNV